MERIAEIYGTAESVDPMPKYDPSIAQAILVVLNERYPQGMTNMELKHALVQEPSDESVLLALEALELEGAITGKGLHESTTGGRRLVVMSNVRLTGEGRKRAEGRPEDSTTGHQVIQNYGHIGSIGSHSVGTVNVQNVWQQIAPSIDLQKLAKELEQLRL